MLTSEGSDWQTFGNWRFRWAPKGLVGLARMPTWDEEGWRLIRHKPLDHFTSAFRTLGLFVCHDLVLCPRPKRKPL
jgi:hypothetical protein